MNIIKSIINEILSKTDVDDLVAKFIAQHPDGWDTKVISKWCKLKKCTKEEEDLIRVKLFDFARDVYERNV